MEEGNILSTSPRGSSDDGRSNMEDPTDDEVIFKEGGTQENMDYMNSFRGITDPTGENAQGNSTQITSPLRPVRELSPLRQPLPQVSPRRFQFPVDIRPKGFVQRPTGQEVNGDGTTRERDDDRTTGNGLYNRPLMTRVHEHMDLPSSA